MASLPVDVIIEQARLRMGAVGESERLAEELRQFSRELCEVSREIRYANADFRETLTETRLKVFAACEDRAERKQHKDRTTEWKVREHS